MTSGVANVRTIIYPSSLIDAPTGWLLNQKNDFLIFFECYKKSISNHLKVYTHLFYANELVEIAQLKNSRFQSIDCVCETRNELILEGWQIVTNKFQ